jgi:23S rRNA G2445 N2-methylase RlmL
MEIFIQTSNIIITCNRRLSSYVALEVEALGYTIEEIFLTGVRITGTMTDCIKLNLNLRCASQVLFSLKKFTCDSPEDLYQAMRRIHWDALIEPDTYFSITSTVFHPSINNNLFANVKVKDAIVDVMRDKKNIRPATGPLQDNAVFHLHWKNNNAEIFIDTSGETLAKHNYRKLPGKAPMLESLATCTLLASKFNKETVFINPMCGSGTLAIEAALIASNRKPGLLRKNYSFMHFIGYNDDLYTHQLQLLFDQIIERPPLQIIATDISKDAIEILKINAANADVEDLIDFDVCPFEYTRVLDIEGGVVFLNPEYGERLGVQAQLEDTYKQIGDFFKQKCKGYTGYVFTGNVDLAKKIGLKATKRIEFYNGKIDCRLLEYELYAGTKRNV